MKTYFRCKRSGNVVGFDNETDIEQMRDHEGYEEVKETPAVPSEQPTLVSKKPRGRQKKVG